VRAKRSDAPSIQRLLEERNNSTSSSPARRPSYGGRPAMRSQLPDSDYKNLVKGHRLRKAHYEAGSRTWTKNSIRPSSRCVTWRTKRRSGKPEGAARTASTVARRYRQPARDLAGSNSMRPAGKHRAASDRDGGLDWIQRYILIGLGGVFGFAVTCFGVAYWISATGAQRPDQIDDGWDSGRRDLPHWAFTVL